MGTGSKAAGAKEYHVPGEEPGSVADPERAYLLWKAFSLQANLAWLRRTKGFAHSRLDSLSLRVRLTKCETNNNDDKSPLGVNRLVPFP